MNRKDIEALRDQVSCAAVLEQAGFAIDRKESTRRAVKFRRGGEIIIVTHEGRGWFDPLSDAKGDVFGLVEHLDHVGFLEGAVRVADLVGFAITEPEWQAPGHDHDHDSLSERWQARRRPWPGSSTWAYLNSERFLPATLRYMPAREDRNPMTVFRDPKHPQRHAIETCPEGHVLVMDSRKDARAASAGDILITRLMVRGGAGVVTDGGFRDAMTIGELDIPAYHHRPSSPTNLTLHEAIDINVPIGCGDVAVFPGDIMV